MSGDKKLDQMLTVLRTPPEDRSDADVDACQTYFRATSLLRAIGRDSENARECCKHLLLESFEENTPVCMQGDFGDCCYFVLDGSLRVLKEGLLLDELYPGDTFGELALLGRTKEEQQCQATVIADEPTHLVSLHRALYLKTTGGFTEAVYRALKTPPLQRSEQDQRVLFTQFQHAEFLQRLQFINLQMKCCKYMTLSVFKRSQKIELKKGQKHLCIVMAGELSLTSGGHAVRSLGENDCFMGDSIITQGDVLTGTKDGAFGVLSKQNYDEVTTNSFAQIRDILSRPPGKRARKELDVAMDMFCHNRKTLPFFRALPSSVLRKNSCKMLGCCEFTKSTVIFHEGDDADCFYIIINGSVKINGELTSGQDQELRGGCEFGHFDGMGGITTDKVAGTAVLNQRTATATVASDSCLVATLAKPDFSRLCQLDEINIWVERFWKLITTKEPSNDTELLQMFDNLDTDGSGALEREEVYQLLDSLGRKPCQEQLKSLMEIMDPDASGEVDFSEFSAWWWERNAEARTSMAPAERPELREMFQNADTDSNGTIELNELLICLKNRGIVNNKEDEAGVHVLFSGFDEDTSGELDYEEFCALVKKLQSGQSTLARLDSQKAPSGIEFIQFEHYKLLHSRIAKSIAPDFTEEEAEVSGRQDWEEDLQRFGTKDSKLDRQQFGHAVFQLVDEWCNGASSTQMIVGWLRMLFSNIVDLHGNLKGLSEIGCIDDDLNNMCVGQRKNDERDKKDAERRFKEHAAEQKKIQKAQIAAKAKADKADKAKRDKEKKARSKKDQQEKKEKAAQARAQKAREKEMNQAAAKTANLHNPPRGDLSSRQGTDSMQRLSALDSEEAELLQKLECGALTAEEEAQVKARLRALDEERKGLQVAAALDSEEAELLQRLESGALTAEEEAQVKARLRALDEERKGLQVAAARVERDRALAALEMEEADLMRRLETGDLTPEEETEIRSRLAAIAAEREAVHAAYAASKPGAVDHQARLASQLEAFDSKLSALDDEEAELLRRLEEGDLTPEEEAKVRARLQAIGEERQQVDRQRAAALAAAGQTSKTHVSDLSAALAAELTAVDQRLSALDDEEAELVRRLQSGELSEDEACAVRSRLDAIVKERESLLEQREAVTQKQNRHARQDARVRAAARKQAAITEKLGVLDDEEAELTRRLASGKLSPAEAKSAQARLDAIAAEKQALQLQAEVFGSQEGLAVELARLDAQLTTLDDEEAELRRKLESGELTAEEEAQIRERLAAIATERQSISDKKHVLVQKQREMNSQAKVALLELELVRLKNQMGALDDEEAQLFRRLATGDLSPAEEAEIRARLAAIDEERAALLEKIEHKEQLVLGFDDQLRAQKSNQPGTTDLMDTHETASPRAENAESPDEHGSELVDLANPDAQDNAQVVSCPTLSATEEELDRHARALRRKYNQRRREVLEEARAASAASVGYMQHPCSTVLFDTHATTSVIGSPRRLGVTEKWYRWTETAERLDGGWSKALVTEYSNRQIRRPSTAQRQVQHQDVIRQSRTRRLKSQHLRQRTKVMMKTARIEQRRTQREYIAAKIATETKHREVKGFTLPAFQPSQHAGAGRSRAFTPTSFTRKRPSTSPEPSSRVDQAHSFNQYLEQSIGGDTANRLANPNLNQGRVFPMRLSFSKDRPKSVAW